jgi:hypothetical protein
MSAAETDGETVKRMVRLFATAAIVVFGTDGRRADDSVRDTSNITYIASQQMPCV